MPPYIYLGLITQSCDKPRGRLRELHVANRDLGTVEHVNSNDLRIRMDSSQEVRFNIREHRHLDYGYAVTSHSSQGQTADQVLVHVDTEKSELLVNDRFAYVSISRGQHDAQICTMAGAGCRTASVVKISDPQRLTCKRKSQWRPISNIPLRETNIRTNKNKDKAQVWGSYD